MQITNLPERPRPTTPPEIAIPQGAGFSSNTLQAVQIIISRTPKGLSGVTLSVGEAFHRLEVYRMTSLENWNAGVASVPEGSDTLSDVEEAFSFRRGPSGTDILYRPEQRVTLVLPLQPPLGCKNPRAWATAIHNITKALRWAINEVSTIKGCQVGLTLGLALDGMEVKASKAKRFTSDYTEAEVIGILGADIQHLTEGESGSISFDDPFEDFGPLPN